MTDFDFHRVLKQAQLDQTQACELYRATRFWREAGKQVTDAVREGGIENFRRLETVQQMFAPSYGPRSIGLSTEQNKTLEDVSRELNKKAATSLNRFLSGELFASADYRVAQASGILDPKYRYTKFSESRVGNPEDQFNFDGKRYSRSSLNYLLGLGFLLDVAGVAEVDTILEIGGGFGTLGELHLCGGDGRSKYIDVDIPPTGQIAEFYLREVFGNHRVFGYDATVEESDLEIDQLPKATVLSPWHLERLSGQVDLFVNFISFQEMEPRVVENYARLISRLEPRWLLLRNLREGKQPWSQDNPLGVVEPISGDQYATFFSSGYVEVARNVMPYGFRTPDGFHSELYLFERRN